MINWLISFFSLERESEILNLFPLNRRLYHQKQESLHSSTRANVGVQLVLVDWLEEQHLGLSNLQKQGNHAIIKVWYLIPIEWFMCLIMFDICLWFFLELSPTSLYTNASTCAANGSWRLPGYPIFPFSTPPAWSYVGLGLKNERLIFITSYKHILVLHTIRISCSCANCGRNVCPFVRIPCW